ncbi:hypothetical protein AXF42_Ash002774 [Apostasia shenzhenica]|uniref:CREG-like beta-barrel domain-containing protein n=1 Tax=Apostasia shenzhenica TaxID=1088818 RepID=A0A2I0A783_9ASPA|nr:hypothetical protein AXF42_Ash002774 [Apostasia shenzhenica]
MEALASSTTTKRLPEPHSWRHPDVSGYFKFPSFGRGFFDSHQSFEALKLSNRRSGFRALINEVTAGGEGGERMPRNGPCLPSAEITNELDINNLSATKEDKFMIPVTGANRPSGSGSSAGLFRTPILGGVNSATYVHDLPPPALAVRNLMEQARFAHLCTVMSRMHHHRAGYPFGSLVDFAADSMGHPIFSLSPLAIHTRNLLADSRCTLVVQIPGWSGLSNARVTIFGDAVPLRTDEQAWARQLFTTKHQQWASLQWGNFYYFRMNTISDIYFIGGFGTVQWVDVKDYERIQPDKIAADGGEQNLKELNAIFSKPLREILSSEAEIDDAALISIDSKGIDIRVRQGAQFNIQRLSFEVEYGVETLEEAKKALQNIINKGFKQ